MSTETTTYQQDILESMEVGVASDVGLKREENQDSYGIVTGTDYRLYIVADGMGGAKGGGTASQLAIATVSEYLNGLEQKVTIHNVVEAVVKANAAIYQKAFSDSTLAGMGTTLVGLFFQGTAVHSINVGDSRAYRIRGNEIAKLTEDHTLVRELVKAGALSSEQAKNHPISHMLTRSLGPSEEIEADTFLSPDGPIRDDYYILCSDGLYNMLPEEEIAEIVVSNDPKKAVQDLVDKANENGGTDNITVIVIRVGIDFPVGMEDITVEYNDSFNKTEISEEAGFTENESVANPEILLSTENVDSRWNSLKTNLQALFRKEFYWSNITISFVALCVLVCGFVVCGFALGRLTYNNPGLVSDLALNSIVGEVAHASLSNTDVKYVSMQLPFLTTLLDEKSRETDVRESTSFVGTSHFGDSDRSNIIKRKEALRSTISDLTGKIDRFQHPITGDIGEALRMSNGRIEELNRRLDSIREGVDVATRKLAVWFGRRKRLAITDPVTMANEVAVSYQDVKERKEKLEQVSWEYLKALETFRLNPQNKEIERKYLVFLKQRDEEVRLLSVAVKKAIDEAVSVADQEIAELTLERDRIQSELEAARREAEFLKLFINANPEQKAKLKARLESDRETIIKELDELRRLLPDP